MYIGKMYIGKNLYRKKCWVRLDIFKGALLLFFFSQGMLLDCC